VIEMIEVVAAGAKSHEKFFKAAAGNVKMTGKNGVAGRHFQRRFNRYSDSVCNYLMAVGRGRAPFPIGTKAAACDSLFLSGFGPLTYFSCLGLAPFSRQPSLGLASFWELLSFLSRLGPFNRPILWIIG
jgi:hypothetical protein